MCEKTERNKIKEKDRQRGRLERGKDIQKVRSSWRLNLLCQRLPWRNFKVCSCLTIASFHLVFQTYSFMLGWNLI